MKTVVKTVVKVSAVVGAVLECECLVTHHLEQLGKPYTCLNKVGKKNQNPQI